MSDDGVGVRVVQRIREEFRLSPEVAVVDGGTLGLDLLPLLEGVDKLLVVDAVETGGVPGTIVRHSGDEIPLVMKTKLSPHQMGLQDLLLVAELQGGLPGEMVLLGMQPGETGLGLELTPHVRAGVEALVRATLDELEKWGVTSEPCRVTG